MKEKGVSHIAYFRLDGGSSKLYTQEYVDEKDKKIERLHSIIKEVREYIEKLLREETEITDEDIIDYGMKCQRAYFSDSELGKVLEILDKVGETDVKDKR